MYKQGLARILAVYNMQWLSLVSNIVWGGCLIISFVFFKSYGAFGLCLSYLIAYIMSTIVILPIYYKRKLIPRDTVFSRYALYIWSIVFFVIYLNVYEMNAIGKIITLAASLIISICIFFKYIMLNNKRNETGCTY